MPANLEKTIRVSGDSDGFENLIDKLVQKSDEMYGAMQRGAAEYSKDLGEQQKRLQEFIKLKEDQFRNEMEANTILAENLARRRMESSPEKEIEILQQKKKALEEINETYRQQQFILENIRSNVESQGAGGAGGAGGGIGKGWFGVKASGWMNLLGQVTKPFGRVGGAVVDGLGIGQFLGVGKFAESAMRLGQQFESTRTVAGARMGGGLGSATGYGMNEADFMNYAFQTGEMRGGVNRSSAMSQLISERALGFSTGRFTNMQQLGRYGGDDVSQLTVKFLKKASESDLWNVNEKDFTQIGEKFDFYSVLLQRELQTRETIGGSGMGLGLLSAFGSATGGQSGGRLLERIMGFDQAIRNPNNEFLQAMVFRSLSGSGDLLDTMTRMEQGAFGEGNMADVLQGFQGTYGKGSRALEFALAKFNPQLMGNPELRRAFANADPEMFRNLGDEGQYAKVAGKLGISEKELRAMASGGTSNVEKLTKSLEQFAGELGGETLDKVGGALANTVRILGESGAFERTITSFSDSVDKFANIIEAFNKRKEEGGTTIQALGAAGVEESIGTMLDMSEKYRNADNWFSRQYYATRRNFANNRLFMASTLENIGKDPAKKGK